jgi:hypothetical protein
MHMVKKNNWAASGFNNNISPDLITDELLDLEVVILLQGTNLFGDAIYSYLQLTGQHLKEMFARMQTGENFKPAEYGTVLQAGRGEPTPEVRDEMAKTYNMIDVPMPAAPVQPAFIQPKFFDEE